MALHLKVLRTRAVGLLLLVLLLLLAVSAACAPIQPAPVAPPAEAATPAPTPLPELATETILDVVEVAEGALPLAGEWRTSVVSQFTPEMAAPRYDDSAWQTVQAPARWADQGIGDLTGSGAVVVYRRTADLPAEWEGSPIGISAWFYPYGSQLFVNGTKVEPERLPFAPWADVSALVQPGAPVQLAVVTQYDGDFAATAAAPARIGPLGERSVPKVVREEGALATPGGEAATALAAPEAGESLPGLVLVASGSHGLAELSAWTDMQEELARAGYVSLAAALPVQEASGVTAALDALRADPRVDPDRVAVWGVDAAATAALAASAGAPVRGVIAMTPPMWNRLPAMGDQPVLLLASEQYRGGLVLNQVRMLAEPLGESATVAALPGDGQGMFVMSNTWNDVRAAVLPWLEAHLRPATTE